MDPIEKLALERLLREPPPLLALEWAAEAHGIGWSVIGVEPLRGGVSHATHALRLRGPGGELATIVMRRSVRPDRGDSDFTAAREADVLAVLATTDARAPRLIAVDPSGAMAGVPTVVESFVPGSAPRPTADALETFAHQLATAIVTIHALTGADAESVAVPSFRPYYEPATMAVPSWTTNPDLWRRARAVVMAGAPASASCLIHRDYHQGNTLWVDGRLIGIVDWDRATWASPAIDVAHMRINLVIEFGADVAEAFTDEYRRLSGRALRDLPFWDVADTVDLMHDRPGNADDDENARIEAHLVAALDHPA